MTTRSKNGIVKPRLQPTLLLTHAVPKTVKTALKDPKWKDAMDEEMVALLKNNTWELVPKPPTRQPIGCKWGFRVKHNSDGPVSKYKARLVAKGFHQQPDFDFKETFSPVVKPITIRTILTLATSFHWDLSAN